MPGHPGGRVYAPGVAKKARRGSWKRIAGLALGLCAAGVLVFWLSLPGVSGLRRTNPPTTALIEARAAAALQKGHTARRNQHWVPLARISPWLQQAVVNSEDARFWEHDGVDVVQTQLV